MLRISKLADYGTIVMVYLARHHEALLNAKDVALHSHLSVPTVSKLLKLLSGAGLLVSAKGAKGGYRLARSASMISVADIIQAVEGSHGLTECSHESSACTLEKVCTLRDNWQVISRSVTGALSQVSLSQLAQPKLQVKQVDISVILGETR